MHVINFFRFNKLFPISLGVNVCAGSRYHYYYYHSSGLFTALCSRYSWFPFRSSIFQFADHLLRIGFASTLATVFARADARSLTLIFCDFLRFPFVQYYYIYLINRTVGVSDFTSSYQPLPLIPMNEWWNEWESESKKENSLRILRWMLSARTRNPTMVNIE